MRRTIFLALLGASISFSAHSQLHQVGVLFTKEAVPYSLASPFVGPLHPGGAVFASWGPQTATSWQTSWRAEAGFYHHAHFQQSAYLRASRQWQRSLGSGFALDLGAGLGYLHTFFPDGRFQAGDDGVAQVRDFGRPSATAQVSLGLTWSPAALPDWQVLAQMQGWVEGPFAPQWGVPVFPHTFVQFGIAKTLRTHEEG